MTAPAVDTSWMRQLLGRIYHGPQPQGTVLLDLAEVRAKQTVPGGPHVCDCKHCDRAHSYEPKDEALFERTVQENMEWTHRALHEAMLLSYCRPVHDERARLLIEITPDGKTAYERLNREYVRPPVGTPS